MKLLAGGKLAGLREVPSTTGFCAQEPAVVHFGAPAGCHAVEVVFSSGAKVVLSDVKTGQFVEVVEPK